jgi:hypothetical protein
MVQRDGGPPTAVRDGCQVDPAGRADAGDVGAGTVRRRDDNLKFQVSPLRTAAGYVSLQATALWTFQEHVSF